MKRNLFAVVVGIIVLLAPLPLTAQNKTESEGITSDWKGIDWQNWDEVRKSYYVWGFRAGQNSATDTVLEVLNVSVNSLSGREVQQRIGVAASVKQIVKGIDSVYGDSRNENLPLWDVCGYVVDSIGSFKDESYITLMRQRYNKGPMHQR